MPADDQADTDMKRIYRAQADGVITEDAAQAAVDAVQARRGPGTRNGAPERARPALSRHRRREKVFGPGRGRPMDRNAKARLMHRARALSHATEKGRAYGPVSAKALAVFQALLWGFHNSRSGLCFPSYERIAAAAHCARSTVYEAIAALEAAGLMTWVNRIKRVREWMPGLPGVGASRIRVLRTSNAYVFPVEPSKSEKPTGTAESRFFPLLKGTIQTQKPAQEQLGAPSAPLIASNGR
jgi:hypothetical protein